MKPIGKTGRAAGAAAAFVIAAAPAVSQAALRAPAKRRGYIVGTARSECGRPLSSFTVNAYGFDGQLNDYPMGLPPLGSARGRGGRYALRTVDHVYHRPVNALVRSIEASAPVRYEGHRYELPLAPTDGRANVTAHSGPGIVRNFVLRTSGVKPGQLANRHKLTIGVGDPAQGAFYGTSMLMFLNLGDVPGQTLTVHFAPTTRNLADGCRARPFNRSITLAQYQGSENFIFQDIPLAFYRLTATLRGATTQTVRLALDGQNTTTTSVPFRPVPTSMFGDGSSGPNVTASLTASPYGS